MASNLLIVESPAKAKTIERFLGKDFRVESCFGHVADLVKKGMGIDLKTFTPTYEVSPEKKSVVRNLKQLSQRADTVWLASDEDREGEAIAWHLYNELGLAKKNAKRIVFNEITKAAVTRAIDNPRVIDQNLVDAQQARRILDRIVGFELSPLLWKKIKMGLSAGRVQSVAVRIIVEREREIEAFVPTYTFRTQAVFHTSSNQPLHAELNHRFDSGVEAEAFLIKSLKSNFRVKDIAQKAFKKKPVAPFTTSTLQQEASRKLGYSLSKTMMLAQRLYEAGKITYMRTDSTHLSTQAIKGVHQEILSLFGEKYLQPRAFQTKIKNSQEAHEAIRPTNFKDQEVKISDASQRKLYELIWKRTVASQMSDAEFQKTKIQIETSGTKHLFISEGETLTFDGFLRLYKQTEESADIDENKLLDSALLPRVKPSDILIMQTMRSKQTFTRPKPRYTEASLVKNLEELGIGRPSTYAPTISTIQNREYVIKEDIAPKQRDCLHLELEDGSLKRTVLKENYGGDKGKLIPSDMGKVVNDFLVDNFDKVMDYHFTAEVEAIFDAIAQGEKNWKRELDIFYKDFHPKLEKVSLHAQRVSGERYLGNHPKTAQKVIARIGRFGPLVQIGEDKPETEEKPSYASIIKPYSLESITLAQALKLFDLPREVGLYEDKKVVAAIGRFGPYLRHDAQFYSIKEAQGDNPYSIDINRAIEVIEAKRKADREKFINSFDYQGETLEILNGRWGPYIKFSGKNYKIPKDIEAQKMELQDCIELLENPPKKKSTVSKAGRGKTSKKS